MPQAVFRMSFEVRSGWFTAMSSAIQPPRDSPSTAAFSMPMWSMRFRSWSVNWESQWPFSRGPAFE